MIIEVTTLAPINSGEEHEVVIVDVMNPDPSLGAATLSAAEAAAFCGDVITMGCMVARPLPSPRSAL
jgi:hypothetical protein